MTLARAVGSFFLITAGFGSASASATPDLGTPSGSAATDSTETIDALAWARQVIRARRAVEAAEEEMAPEAQAALAALALGAARELATDPASEQATRSLVLRAQAVYEQHHSAIAPGPLAASEWASLRGERLAQLGDNFAPPLADPAVQAALQAEALRAAGPDHLFYPADAVHLVDAQRAVASRFSRTARRGRSRLRSISRTLRRRDLPDDLRFVAVIESALNPNAESWAGARGLWQFMPATAAEFGLDSLTVVDPAASTEAAARYLRQLRRMFRGDLQLALAAYNCGPGRVQRLIRAYRSEHDDYPTFWDLHDRLPRETQAYVPRFIAVTELLGG